MSLNDRFESKESTCRSSATTINIAGFYVYLYGIDELTPEQAQDTTVLFHIHGRTRTYTDAEEIAHELLSECRKRGPTRKGLVVATLDNRNHGTRSIDNIAIQDWKGGNPRHAQDMLSMIDGIVADIQTVMTFLESYVDGIFSPTEYIVTGLSLGGHVTWDVLAKDCRVKKAIIIVGSPNLTALLMDRLGGYASVADVPAGTKEWPKSIEKLFMARDQSVDKVAGKKILILNGALDPLVPGKFTRPWLDKNAANNDVSFTEQENTGHWLSWEMMNQIVEWTVQELA